MNEKIKELAEQAHDVANDGSIINIKIPRKFIEKFSELIVQECIEVVLSSEPSPKMIAHEPYNTIVDNIKEHFGVEAPTSNNTGERLRISPHGIFVNGVDIS